MQTGKCGPSNKAGQKDYDTAEGDELKSADTSHLSDERYARHSTNPDDRKLLKKRK